MLQTSALFTMRAFCQKSMSEIVRNLSMYRCHLHANRLVFFFMPELVFLPSHKMFESLILVGCSENANTPMLHSKLPHLKNLEIKLESAASCPLSFDFFSLVSFLDPSPALESFILRLNRNAMAHYPVVGDVEKCPRRKVGFWHNRLRQVTVTGFCSAKSLVQLTVHILEGTHSLQRLTLDTTYGYDRMILDPATIGNCPNSRMTGRCQKMSKSAVEEAHRAVKTAGRYITGRVPLAVQFEVLEPCSRCHTGNQ